MNARLPLQRRWRALTLVCAALGLLAGCQSTTGLLEAPQVDYKSAGQLPPLEIPPDLTAPRRDNRYVVPETGKGTTTLSSYKADQVQAKARGDSDVLPTADNMRIEGRGNERWLVVENKTPQQLWPEVKDFWQENGFLVRKATPETGIMETDWAENRAKLPQDIIRKTLGSLLDQVYSTSERDMFRTRLERTPDGRGTEIYISHRGMEEVYVPGSGREQTKWQPRDTDPTLEAEFLRRLMVRLGAQEDKAKLLVANAAQQPERAKIKKGPDGSEVLEVDEPFDRAWRRVGLALDRVGFTVEDRDRAKGLYYVRYADPDPDMKRKDEKPGLLDKLAFWKSSEPQVKAEQYRVSVAQESDGSQVRVLGKDGKAETTATGHRILSLLHQELK